MAATNAVQVDASNAGAAAGVGRRRGCLLGRARRPLRPVRDPPTTSGCSPRRRSATATACSTSDAVPVRPPCARPERRRTGRRSGVDLSSHMLDVRAAPRRRRGHRQRRPSSRPTRRSTRSRPAAFDVAISNTGATFFGDLGRRAHQHRPRACAQADASPSSPGRHWPNNEWVREFTGALAAGRDLPAPPPDAPEPLRAVRPRPRSQHSHAAPASPTSSSKARREGMWFGTDADDAHEFVLGLLGWMLEGLDDAGRARALDALRSTHRNARHARRSDLRLGGLDHPSDAPMTASNASLAETSEGATDELFAVTRDAAQPGQTAKGAFEQPAVNDHAAFMNDLADEGLVLFAGPLAGSEAGRIRVLLIADAADAADIDVVLPTIPGRSRIESSPRHRALEPPRRHGPASRWAARRRVNADCPVQCALHRHVHATERQPYLRPANQPR